MVTLFHDIMHKEIKVYVDDMIANSRTPKDNLILFEKDIEVPRQVLVEA